MSFALHAQVTTPVPDITAAMRVCGCDIQGCGFQAIQVKGFVVHIKMCTIFDLSNQTVSLLLATTQTADLSEMVPGPNWAEISCKTIKTLHLKVYRDGNVEADSGF